MNPKLSLLAARHGGVFSRSDALECGYTRRQIRDRLDKGVWTPLRRGIYAELADIGDLPPWEQERVRHRLAVHAVHHALGAGAVVSHQSALVLHGLPTWGLRLDEVHVTRRDRLTGRTRSGIRHHAGRSIGGEDLVAVEGITATAVPRAVVETACIAGYESAVAFMDAALHQRLLTSEQLAEMVARVRSWPGSGTARAAAAFANGRSESVGESRLRVLMDNHGLPTPRLQSAFVTASGQVGARVDFHFREDAVVVEFDGRVKYRENASDVVLREKQREDRLRAGGVLVVRVTWDELDHPELVIGRIRRAFELAKRAGFGHGADDSR